MIEQKLKTFSQKGLAAVNKAHRDKAMRDREARAARAADALLAEFAEAVQELHGRFFEQAEPPFDATALKGPNGVLVRKMAKRIMNCWSTVEKHMVQIGQKVKSERAGLDKLAGELSLRHDKQELGFRLLIEKYKDAERQSAERGALERKLNTLIDAQRQRNQLARRLRKLETARRALLEKLLDLRGRRFATRRQVVKRLNSRVATQKIRVRIEQDGNNDRYRALLEESLRNVGIQPRQVAAKLAGALTPAELTAAVAAGRQQVLEDDAELNANQAATVIEALANSPRLLELEAVELVDLPHIELEEGGDFKDSLSLSTGQKCTAVLPILLVDNSRPLLIDQPEDNLDNGFIYDTVVKCLRDIKQRRQLIFVTHNPNIPVLGSADKVVVLASDGHNARIANEGDVDHCRHEIIDLLEGGDEAFRERQRRYGF